MVSLNTNKIRSHRLCQRMSLVAREEHVLFMSNYLTVDINNEKEAIDFL